MKTPWEMSECLSRFSEGLLDLHEGQGSLKEARPAVGYRGYFNPAVTRFQMRVSPG